VSEVSSSTTNITSPSQLAALLLSLGFTNPPPPEGSPSDFVRGNVRVSIRSSGAHVVYEYDDGALRAKFTNINNIVYLLQQKGIISAQQGQA
jgi:hypothetical protein